MCTSEILAGLAVGTPEHGVALLKAEVETRIPTLAGPM